MPEDFGFTSLPPCDDDDESDTSDDVLTRWRPGALPWNPTVTDSDDDSEFDTEESEDDTRPAKRARTTDGQ